MPDYNLPTVTQSGDLRDYTPDQALKALWGGQDDWTLAEPV